MAPHLGAWKQTDPYTPSGLAGLADSRGGRVGTGGPSQGSLITVKMLWGNEAIAAGDNESSFCWPVLSGWWSSGLELPSGWAHTDRCAHSD